MVKVNQNEVYLEVVFDINDKVSIDDKKRCVKIIFAKPIKQENKSKKEI